MSTIHLTSTVRSNLLNIQRLTSSLNDTTSRLSSTLKVARPSDDAEAYYAASGLNFDADRLDLRLDGMSESIQVIKATDSGISSIKEYLTQMQGIVDDALANTDPDARRELGAQFNVLIKQVRDLAQDTSYSNINLLCGNESSTVYFSETPSDGYTELEGINISAADGDPDTSGEIGSSSVVINNVAYSNNGLSYMEEEQYALTMDGMGDSVIGIKSAGTSGDGWEVDWGSDDYDDILNSVESNIEDLYDALGAQSNILQAGLELITLRQTFTETKTSILRSGAAELTEADLDEEAANVTTLKSSIEIAVQNLSLASTQSQQALTLLQS